MSAFRFGWGLLLLVCAGCASTVDGVCEDIADECRETIDEPACKREGDALEEVAENTGCDDAFEEHLDCLDERLCSWERDCADTLEELLECVS